VSAKARARFLETLAEGWSVRQAARAADVGFQRLYELKSEDEGFARLWEEALELGTERLEQHAMTIALEGALVEVRNGAGEIIRTERRPDPQMTRFLLSARKPDVYSQRAQVQLTGAGGGPVEVQSGFTPTSLAEVARLARELGAIDAFDVVDGEVMEAPLELEGGDVEPA
jgi:hypothetical protein